MTDAIGNMGLVEVLPADGLRSITLRCCCCPAERSWPAPFYSDRVLALGVARREGWGFLADGMRRCPVCQAIAKRVGRWGNLAHKLQPGLTHKLGADFPVYANPDFMGSAAPEVAPPVQQAPASMRAPSATLQLDLFGAAA